MTTEQLTDAAEWAERWSKPVMSRFHDSEAVHLRTLAQAARILADADVEQINDTCHRQWSDSNFWIPPHSQVLVTTLPRKDANEN